MSINRSLLGNFIATQLASWGVMFFGMLQVGFVLVLFDSERNPGPVFFLILAAILLEVILIIVKLSKSISNGAKRVISDVVKLKKYTSLNTILGVVLPFSILVLFAILQIRSNIHKEIEEDRKFEQEWAKEGFLLK